MRPGGSLLIADFAPHMLEFLRDDDSHRRLGFSDRGVEGWLAAARLRLASTDTIDPPPGGNKLTVKVWLAQAGEGRTA